MDTKVKVDLGNVQKTLFLPLWGRAVETKKAKPMIVDETAVRIIQQVDYDFSAITKNTAELSQVAWIMRSLYTDQVIRGFTKKYPHGTIVNVGCGLDTAFERVDNGTLKWYDLDLPDVIELRKNFIQESDRRKFLSASFLDKDWLQTIEIEENVLFIIAGVLYYFKEEQVKEFLLRLADTFPGCEAFFDVSSPTGVKIANKRVIESTGLDEKSHLIWGLEDTRDLLAWDPRIQIIKTYYYFRSPLIRFKYLLAGTISDLMKIQYMLHLKLGTK
jgi:O-methyltransferase involved in polyketide biosynthesis